MHWEGPAFTPVNIHPHANRIRYGDTILLIGSCFTEHIGDRLRHLKYTVNQNPFGILYNPVSMATALTRIVREELYTTSELVAENGLFHSMDHHGSFSGPDANAVAARINENISKANADLRRSKFVFISPGTAIAYRYIASGAVAGNCHKIPQASFSKTILTIEDCMNAYRQMREAIHNAAPEAMVIWTISPVRHLSEGLVQNQRSKALLIASLGMHLEKFAQDAYFPAYEIMMDQLRDYRYYSSDMTHPSPEAVEIIWKSFRHMFMQESEFQTHEMIEKIRRAMAHRFLHDQPGARQKFAQAQLTLIAGLEATHAGISFEAEKSYFNAMLLL